MKRKLLVVSLSGMLLSLSGCGGKSYTIQFVNYDGTLIYEVSVKEGVVPECATGFTYKPGDAQYSYNFKGWSPEISPATADVVYTAQYEQLVNKYTVRWLNWDNSLLSEEEYSYGSTPSYGSDPTRISTTSTEFTFAGWSPEVVAVTENATYTATFNESPRMYTITWLNDDSSVISTQQVPYGTVPEYEGETPTKDPTDTTVYTFDGWTETLAEVTGDRSYMAKYTESERKVKVTFKNFDGTVLEEKEIAYKANAKYTKERPAKDGGNNTYYLFSGWDNSLEEITTDTVFTAQFTEKHNVEYVYDNSGNVKAVEFGRYPQSLVEYDESDPTIKELFDKYGTTWASSGVDYRGLTYQQLLTEKVNEDTTSEFESVYKYADIDLNDDGEYDYRSFVIETDRISSGRRIGEQNKKYETYTQYFFKIEPIKWDLYSYSSGADLFTEDKLLLETDHILDCRMYDTHYVEYTVSGVSGKKTPSNYQYSFIREWLNEEFYNQAFSKADKEFVVKDRKVSVEFWGNRSYTNTYSYTDPLTLPQKPSSRGVRRWGTDYAFANGLHAGNYLCRDPKTYAEVYEIDYDGSRTYGNACDKFAGVVPQLAINISSLKD